jgi:ACT domain-containing protein
MKNILSEEKKNITSAKEKVSVFPLTFYSATKLTKNLRDMKKVRILCCFVGKTKL